MLASIFGALAIGFAMLVIGDRLAQFVFRNSVNAVEATFIGLTAVSSLLSLIYCFTSIRIDYAFIALTLVAIPLAVDGGSTRLGKSLKSFDPKLFAVTALSGVVIVVMYLFPAVANIQEVSTSGGLLLAHIDLFTHASVINQIALQSEIGNTQVLLDGSPVPIYHYGLYILPSVLVKYAGWAALDLLVYFILPFGIFALWFLLNDIVAHITASRGYHTMVLSLAALVAADASRSLVYSNSLFDLPYLLGASPGAIYGLATLLLATKNYLADNRIRVATFLFCIFLLSGFRVLYIPIFVLFSTAAFVMFSRMSRIKKAALLSGTVLLSTIASRNIGSPLGDFYRFMLTFFRPDAQIVGYTGSFPRLLAVEVMTATLGGTLLMLIGFGSLYMARAGRWRVAAPSLRILVSMLVGYYCALLLSVTLRNGDMTELLQRPFVVLNLICAILIISMLYVSISRKYMFNFVTAILLGNVLWLSREYGYPDDHPWHQLSYKVPVDEDIVRVSRWFEDQGVKSVYVVLPLRIDSYSVYPEAVITALSGRRAFVSRLGAYLGKNDSTANDIRERTEYLNEVASCRGVANNTRHVFFVTKDVIPCRQLKAVVGSYKVYM
jgi:hypothetical protein